MRISKRYVQITSVFLVVGTFAALSALMAGIQNELAATRIELANIQGQSKVTKGRLADLANELGAVDERSSLRQRSSQEARARLEARLERALREGRGQAALQGRLSELDARVKSLSRAAKDHEQLLESARHDADVQLRYRELMSPTVRVQSKSEVGSGTILLSKPVGRGRARSYVLTAYHIVEEAEDEDGGTPLEVDFYAKGKLIRTELAKLVARQIDLDLALLEVRGYHVYTTKARIPTRGGLARTPVFSKVYAIGCPLGYSPLPTSGELTSKEKELDGSHYWMINAPTIFGNSGGGIYEAKSRTMIGVLSRISAYKNMIDVAVPHMGLVTPLNQVYDWLDGTRYAFVYRERLTELRTLTAGAAKATETTPLPAGSNRRKK
ncbi:MAG: trypsin-like peptidase domain-containing protein [Planctomycetes bacterium]|nr:trypsin-like peptidase domain-containing protein [Planctomycetota bacterium]